jgi:hypothetical protein
MVIQSFSQGNQEPEETALTVAEDLFGKMESTLRADYGRAIKITKRIDGTAFFPGGIGLWRGLKRHGPVPGSFPKSPVMFLAHNFDSEVGFDRSLQNGIEDMGRGTWFGQQKYLEGASLVPEKCFFTNVFLGLMPGNKGRGSYPGSDAHKEECREFLSYQIRRTRPCLIAVLGTPALEQFNMIECPYPYVHLQHPSYASNFGWESEKGQAIIRENSERLSYALKKHGCL